MASTEAASFAPAGLPSIKTTISGSSHHRDNSSFTRPTLSAADLMQHGRKKNTPKVDVSQQAGFFCHIHAQALVDMPPDVVYDVLTHPDNHIIFESQKECAYRNVIAEEESGMLQVEVEHTAAWNFMFLSGVFHTRTMVHQSKWDGMVEYYMTRPSPVLKRFKGSWTLEPCTPPDGSDEGSLWTLMTLDQDMHPNMIPPPPADKFLRGMLGRQIKVMFNDMLKEFAALRAGKPQLSYPPDPYKLINVEPFQPSTPPAPSRESPLQAPSPLTSGSFSSSPAPSLTSSSSSNSLSTNGGSPYHPPPRNPLSTPTRLSASAVAAAAATAAASPAPNLTAHMIDISESDMESDSDDEQFLDVTAAADQAPPASPLPKHPSLPSLLGARDGPQSDSTQSFFSCDDDLAWSRRGSDEGTDPETTTMVAARVACASAPPPWLGVRPAAGAYLRSSSLALWVEYFWSLLPEVASVMKVARAMADDMLTRLIGTPTPAAGVGVSWEEAGSCAAAGGCM